MESVDNNKFDPRRNPKDRQRLISCLGLTLGFLVLTVVLAFFSAAAETESQDTTNQGDEASIQVSVDTDGVSTDDWSIYVNLTRTDDADADDISDVAVAAEGDLITLDAGSYEVSSACEYFIASDGTLLACEGVEPSSVSLEVDSSVEVEVTLSVVDPEATDAASYLAAIGVAVDYLSEAVGDYTAEQFEDLALQIVYTSDDAEDEDAVEETSSDESVSDEAETAEEETEVAEDEAASEDEAADSEDEADAAEDAETEISEDVEAETTEAVEDASSEEEETSTEDVEVETVTTTVDDATGQTTNLTVHFIDVGQGDCTFIELPDGSCVLIDAGERNASDDVISYIRSLGYSTIDYVIATHPHADHIGGLIDVLGEFEVGELWAPAVSASTNTFFDFLEAVEDAGLSINVALQGDVIVSSDEWGYSLEVLGPDDDISGDDLNDYSLILLLTYGDNTVLLAGDAPYEETLQDVDGHVDVLKVAHHGSYTGTNQSLSELLSPSIAVISYGEGNSYGHPHQVTLDALESVGATIYGTAVNGNVVVTLDGSTVSVVVEREGTVVAGED